MTQTDIDTLLQTTGINQLCEGVTPAQWRAIKHHAVRWIDLSFPRPIARWYAPGVTPDRCNVVPA